MESPRARALAAARAILARDGYAGLTMERVAAASGVAKTTLYRRWNCKGALCVELYFDVAARELRDPDTGDVAADLERITNTVVHLQTRTIAGAALTGVLAEAQLKGDGAAELIAEFAEKRRSLTRAVLRRAIARGQLREDADVDLVIDAIGGATTFRLLQGHAPLTRKFAAGLVRLVLSGCRK